MTIPSTRAYYADQTPKIVRTWLRSAIAAVVLFLASLTAQLYAESEKVIFFGDSITAGGTWPGTVADAMGWQDVNAGVSGRLLVGSLGALQEILGNHPDADRIVILLGVNDLPDRNTKPGPERVQDCIDAMRLNLTECLKSFSPSSILLLGPCNTNPEGMSDGNRYGKGYGATPNGVKLSFLLKPPWRRLLVSRK